MTDGDIDLDAVRDGERKHLQDAALQDAALQDADLRWADLRGADLRDARLPRPMRQLLDGDVAHGSTADSGGESV